ncbi:unnamed protein product [Cylicostephanus goldi]|uniref:Uncharacterized protein n=1 Tax=Cylicostephanus goldi TaxID=71465 RepID=A0A3P7N0N1_CYLGO|nr:unnamed protein product [Cylicostephanus goldi]
MMQEVLDQAIEDTCRNFRLLSPYHNDLNKGDQEVKVSDQNMKVFNTTEDLTVDEDCGITYDGMICKERAKKFPTSYYHVEEMNKGPGKLRFLDYFLTLKSKNIRHEENQKITFSGLRSSSGKDSIAISTRVVDRSVYVRLPLDEQMVGLLL